MNNSNFQKVFALCLAWCLLLSFAGCQKAPVSSAPPGQNSSSDLKTLLSSEPPHSSIGSGPNSISSEEKIPSPEELEGLLASQEVVVTKTHHYHYDSPAWGNPISDSLQVVIENHSEKDVRDVRVVMAAWDENGLPLKLSHTEEEEPAGSLEIDLSEVNLVPGDTYGEDENHIVVDQECVEIGGTPPIETLTAVVRSYLTVDGETWENPYYEVWEKIYVGQKLSAEAEKALNPLPKFSTVGDYVADGELKGEFQALAADLSTDYCTYQISGNTNTFILTGTFTELMTDDQCLAFAADGAEETAFQLAEEFTKIFSTKMRYSREFEGIEDYQGLEIRFVSQDGEAVYEELKSYSYLAALTS